MSTRKKKQNGTGEPGQTESRRITYDPIEPQYNALHRAGMAGLALQIKAMEKANAAVRPKVEWIENGRAIEVTLNLLDLRALLQERYLGVKVTRELQPKKSRQGEASKAAPQVKTTTYPRLRYFEVLGAADLAKRQDHIRSMYYQSFFQIYQENQRFFKAPENTRATSRNPAVDENAYTLWQALMENQPIDIQKSTRPNSVKYDLKGTRLCEVAKQTLLLHFWPLASSFFSTTFLKYDRKTKQLVDDRLPPVIVVPDVSHVKKFLNHIDRSFTRNFLSPVINTALEAALAFYVAPRLAHGQAITEEIFNEFVQSVRGATVFGYLRPTKQPEVREVSEETYSEDRLQAYSKLIRRGLNSPPYRALRIQNLISNRPWHHGFDRLIDEWKLELFVPVKNAKGGSYEWRPKGEELARDLATDFAYFREMEDDMADETKIVEVAIPIIIDDLVGKYLDWLVYSRGQTPPEKEEMKKLFGKKRALSDGSSLSGDEDNTLKKYNEHKLKIVNREFVAFRGATNQRRFAEMFVGMFEAGFNIEPQEREMLRPFYEGNQWESGRWLTLMAISARSAPPHSAKKSTNGDNRSDDNGRSKSNDQ